MEVPRGFTRCDECEGTGEVCSAFCDSNDRTVDAHPHHIPCPSCSGSGLVPTEKLREEIAVAIDPYLVHPLELPDVVDAVLAKVAEHIREER